MGKDTRSASESGKALADAEPRKAGKKPRVTTRRKLHSSDPYWQNTPHSSVASSAAPSRRDYDVIVVGGGISGALTAQALSEAGQRVLIVDKAVAVRGSSAASTAMIQHEIDVPLHQLAPLIGRSKANRVWLRSARAVRDLTELVTRLAIDCSFEQKKTLFVSGDVLGSRALKIETRDRNKAGLDAEYLDKAELLQRFGIKRTAGIVSHDSASANPAQLTAGLLRDAISNGAELVENFEIADALELGDQVVLSGPGGMLLQASHVVFATGYEFLKAMDHSAHRIVSTWALASEPGLAHPSWLDEFLVWEGSDPYLYFRATPDGRIIAGGEDEDSPTSHSDPKKMRRKMRLIRQKLKKLTGIDIGEPAYDWAAPFGTTTTGLPFIDCAPGHKRIHSVMGFGGNGITFSMIASQIIKGRILGHADPDAELFAFPK